MSSSYFMGNPVVVGRDVNLFIDEFAYEDRWDMERRINTPSKYSNNPVLIADQPWEQSVGAPSVLYDSEEGFFRMWYAVYDSAAYGYQYLMPDNHMPVDKITTWDPAVHGYPYTVGYAESSDGMHWSKPRIKGKPFKQYEDTNIIITGVRKAQGFCVRHTPEHMKDRGRFMIVYRDNQEQAGGQENDNLYLFFSSDGIKWEPFPGNPIYPRAWDDEASLTYDERYGLWVLHTRPSALAANDRLKCIPRDDSYFKKENVRTRVAVTVSEDLKSWHPTRNVMSPDERDGQFFFDVMVAEKYGNQFLGFLVIQPRDAEAKGYIELASSPDGLDWYRSTIREPFIPPGREGDWDGGHVWYVENIVPYGDRVHLYYSGAERPWRVRHPENTRGIGLARITRDRFAGQYAGIEGGFLLSREVRVSGSRLLVNFYPHHRAFTREAPGSMEVELLDREGMPIKGFTFEDCEVAKVNAIEHPVSWKGSPDISKLEGQNVYIRFLVKSGQLYGFRFGGPVKQ